MNGWIPFLCLHSETTNFILVCSSCSDVCVKFAFHFLFVSALKICTRHYQSRSVSDSVCPLSPSVCTHLILCTNELCDDHPCSFL